jgi:hypothetical protein
MYAKMARQQKEREKRLRAWAKGLNLTQASPVRRCLHWLAGEKLRAHYCKQEWMDHVTVWSHAGKPAVLLSQPYGLNDVAKAQLAEVANGRFAVCQLDTGWYGGTTSSIEVWTLSAYQATH